jgi:antitoxin (DNA-binding transcriptional repressor) of toxin-antitoxin stability system
MRTITATELARNLREVLDRLARDGEEVIVERNQRQVARLVPGPAHQTALEALGDLYRTLDEEAAAGWLEDARLPETLDEELRDPWA